MALPKQLAGLLDLGAKRIEVGIRPENITAVPPGAGTLPARLLDTEPLGPACALRCAVGGAELTVLAPPELAARMAAGDPLALTLDTTKLHPFGADGARLN